MINIACSTHQNFVFPATLSAAFEYFSDMNRILNYLPNISILHCYADGQYRVLYSTTELGVYRVRIICDMQTELDRKAWTIRIHPLDGISPIKSEASIYSLTGQGYYASESILKDAGDKTQIEFKLRLHARLNVPLGLRFMPGNVVNNIAQNITMWRIQEVAGGFIERALRAYRP